MKIMQLGKSSAECGSNQFNVSYLIETGGLYILLETPPAVANQLKKAGISQSCIDWVYLSHQHGDHFIGLPMLLVAEYIKKSDKIWNIILQESMVLPVTQLIKIAYPELEQYCKNKVNFWVVKNNFRSL